MGNFEPIDQLELRFSSVTVNVDGYLDSKEAALFEPYSDDHKNSGKTLCSEDMLSDSVGKMVAAGLQPCIVAMGDRAVDLALTVIENLPKRVRFRIEQAAVLNEGLVQRLKQQQVVVSVQPKVISTEFSVWSAVEHLGLKRAKWLHPLKTLIIAGVKVVGGSDCPMEPLNPLLGIQEVVLRQVFPEQRLSVEEALKMYTLYAAFSSSEEAIKGSIEEGKLADLTVLSNDITEVAMDKIKDIKVEHVVVNGVLLF
jgi:predicted amidohydrolase YtcJ